MVGLTDGLSIPQVDPARDDRRDVRCTEPEDREPPPVTSRVSGCVIPSVGAGTGRSVLESSAGCDLRDRQSGGFMVIQVPEILCGPGLAGFGHKGHKGPEKIP